jgi:hypothetical protein
VRAAMRRGGGDAGVPGVAENAGGQVPQGGHDTGAVAGPDLGGILGVSDVADVVKGLDPRVPADPSGGGGLSLVKRRTAIITRLDSYLELLGPACHAAFGGDLTLFTPLRTLAAGYADPHAIGPPGLLDGFVYKILLMT